MMDEILLCSNNPLLIKSLYAILRDDGCSVDVVEHPSDAVRLSMKGSYHALVIDSEPFGLRVEEAIQIVKTFLPNIHVVVIGVADAGDGLSIELPLDLEDFRRAMKKIRRTQDVH